MDEQRRQVLEMLGEGKITAAEAEQLLDALGREQPASPPVPARRPKYLRVVAEDNTSGDGAGRINIRVPVQLLRAGVRLTSLVPPQVLTRVNEQLAKSGVPIDLTGLKPQQLEEVIEQLDELIVDIGDSASKVRVFCE
jgi:hypothetical protein